MAARSERLLNVARHGALRHCPALLGTAGQMPRPLGAFPALSRAPRHRGTDAVGRSARSGRMRDDATVAATRSFRVPAIRRTRKEANLSMQAKDIMTVNV